MFCPRAFVAVERDTGLDAVLDLGLPKPLRQCQMAHSGSESRTRSAITGLLGIYRWHDALIAVGFAVRGVVLGVSIGVGSGGA